MFLSNGQRYPLIVTCFFVCPAGGGASAGITFYDSFEGMAIGASLSLLCLLLFHGSESSRKFHCNKFVFCVFVCFFCVMFLGDLFIVWLYLLVSLWGIRLCWACPGALVLLAGHRFTLFKRFFGHPWFLCSTYSKALPEKKLRTFRFF